MLVGLVKGALKSTLVIALVAAGGVSYGYYRLAAGKLPAPDGAVVTTGLCRPTGSISGATLPVTFEAYLKDERTHNFLATSGGAGLVKARFEWSHGGWKWVEDRGFAERQADAVRAREKLARRDVDALIKDLRSEDAIAREVSAKELRLRTGEARGYAYDAPKDERAKAAAAWERWWADDKNKMRYGAKRALDAADTALETLRRALGEGGEKK